MKDYETYTKNYYLCKACYGKPIPGDITRPATMEENIDETCCSSGSGSEYYGASVRSWSCGRSAEIVVTVQEYQEV